jgi:5-methylcytosine-specific restriction protein B
VLYKMARQAGAQGFTSNDMSSAIGYDGAQFRGLMAAFAVRINRSPRETYPTKKPGVDLLFVQKWLGDQNRYTPRPELLAAINRLPSLSAYLDKPLDQIVAGGSHSSSLPADVPLKPPSKPATVAQEPPPKAPFHQVLRTLDDGGLYFPGETVANVLLAMQVKRFVILTGISGTGKTRIAQAIAGRFPLTRKVAVPQEVDDRSVVVTLAPYVHKRRRIVLPAALAAQVPGVLQQQGSGTIQARCPGGAIELSTYRINALVVMFKGELRKWMDKTFKEGDQLVLRLDGPPDAPPDVLVFEKPTTAVERIERRPNAEIIPVRPDWTDSRGLLGFYNPLTRKYVTTPFLRLLLAAEDEARRAASEKRPPHPFFVLLDEMNLARVEHYFSDLLSAMESVTDEADENGGMLHLHDEESLEEGESEDEEAVVPRRLRIPPNLFIVGTVNVDESTYMFSPKVLDRAFTIEFNGVDLGGLGKHIEDGGELDLVRWNGTLAPPRPSGRDDWRWLTEHRDGSLGVQLGALHGLLASTNRHFGYRVACEIARFVRLAVEQAADDDASGEAAARAALDLAVLQKVLVKLAGTQAEIARLLDHLLWFTLLGRRTAETERDLGLWRLDPVEGEVVPSDEASEEVPVFPRSAAKLWRMQRRLVERGFTSWIE